MSNGEERLLIIDDELKMAKIVAKGGEMSGYVTAYTDKADEFFHRLATWCPTVVVVDLQMPDTDGIELLRAMAAQGATAKVVVCSGIDARTIDTTIRLGTELGLEMGGAMNKPVRLAEIRSLLEKLKSGSDTAGLDGLRQAIENDELFLAYQPKIDLHTGAAVGAEALVRWQTPTGATLPPDSFLPYAEENGLMGPLTEWVMRNAVDQVAQWAAADFHINLAVNISATNLHDLSLPDALAEMCRASGLKANNFTLELTETASMRDAAKMMDVLARFRIKEFSLSIDDFGTGYSSLVQLQRLPFSEIKIDRSFVFGMDKIKENAVIAKTVIDMGHNLGLQVCAEGVENEASLEMLKEYGCDFAQGYLISKPIAASDIPPFFAAHERGLDDDRKRSIQGAA
jgi:EAL domain-containing protein (putative c-di-GMP-specific phosphodiesterase class I)/ActR/RegA family two-component response regulator